MLNTSFNPTLHLVVGQPRLLALKLLAHYPLQFDHWYGPRLCLVASLHVR